MGGVPSPRRSRALATFLEAAVQPAPARIKDLEEHHLRTVEIQVDCEDAPYPANPGDLSPAPSHEDLARGNDRDLCLGREGAAAGVLLPELQGLPLPDDGGEEGRKADPRLKRNGDVKHELSGRALGVDPRGDDPHLRDPPAPMAAPPVAISISSFRDLGVGVQWKREPRRRPLTLRPRTT